MERKAYPVLDYSLVVMPGFQAEYDHMLSRFEKQRYSKCLSSVTTVYVERDGKRFFHNVMRKYNRAYAYEDELDGRGSA